MNDLVTDFSNNCEETFSPEIKRKVDKISAILGLPSRSIDEKERSRKRIFKVLYFLGYIYYSHEDYKILLNNLKSENISNFPDFVDYLRRKSKNDWFF